LPALWGKTSFLWTALDPVLGAVNGDDDVPDVAIPKVGQLGQRDPAGHPGGAGRGLDSPKLPVDRPGGLE